MRGDWLSVGFYRLRPSFRRGAHRLTLRLDKLGHIEFLDLLAGPKSSAQKLEAGFYRGVALKAVDLDSLSQVRETIALNQLSHHRLKGKPMQWIIRLLIFRLGVFSHGNEILGDYAFTLGKI